ncbi:alpha/beta hydrolase [Pseudonocardia acaciae]|uniref:alpha/beta hydrolase n=1 Tax=Pseudonocardia acaciae TaxID=551276 RepID=UPI00056D2267|nr:alpha/beta hydrolase [Pseudonocardia acaciae]
MPIDPQVRALLDQLASAGAIPLVRGSARETREHYRTLAMARRGDGYRPEPVAGVADHAIDGPGGPLPLRVYTPAVDRGRVFTFLHGGGWVVGDLDTHDPVCRALANSLGATVVAVDYRLAPEHPHPAALDDTMAALAWTAAEFPGRPHVVGGDSAGGSLAAGAALRARDAGGPRLAAQLLIYPATDPTLRQPSMRDNAEGFFLTGRDVAWFYDRYVPAEHRTEPVIDLLHAADLDNLPPSVVTTAEFDPLRDEGDAYAERLRAAGVRVEHVPAAGLIHGYFGFLGLVDAADKYARVVLGHLDGLLP